MAVIIIKCTPKKQARVIPEPQTPWYKGLNDNQRKEYIASLDHLDPAATRRAVIPQRASA